MPKLSDLLKLPTKIKKRADYIRGRGFNVEVRTVYTRIRRVRALNEEDAKMYAMAREAEFAPKYFAQQNHNSYKIETIDAVGVTEVDAADAS